MSRSGRRGFLQKAAAAGSWLATRTWSGAADVAGQASRRFPEAPVAVVAQSVSTDANARARSWVFLEEILRRAGIFFERVPPDRLAEVLQRRPPVVLLAGHLPLTAAQRELLAGWVREGGALAGIGGTSGLDEVFGVTGTVPLAEAWIKVSGPEHPVTAGLRSSLHVFGGCSARAGTATVLAGFNPEARAAKGSAILENRFGNGTALLLAPDLMFSVVHIQQGLPVLQDGRAAPDGSAIVNEGVLKAEDGLVLDWELDRQAMAADGAPCFLEPVSDELREIVLRTVFHLARQRGIALPVLWYWPRRLPGVGHVSHDSDHNDPAKAAALLDAMNRCGIKSTWCMLHPGGYPPEFYRALAGQGFETALHYDAMSGGPQTSWGRNNFLFQCEWLRKEAGLPNIFTNKNHYTRWEGRLDLLRWCEQAGIGCDQTRGPSKPGTIGFPLGGSQPYFALDDEAEQPRFLDVLEINLMTQDLVVVCPAAYGAELVDSASRHHGVAHFLFHPNHILKPGVADALSGVVDYGRRKGLEWWTALQIREWETRRRGVAASFDSAAGFALRAPASLPQATLLLLASHPAPRSVTVDGQPQKATRWSAHGFDFDAVTLDLNGSAVRVRDA